MINVTYVGDTLFATKVSGDKNVPRGEVSFRADLSPKEWTGTSDDSSLSSGGDDAAYYKPLLQPIELSKEAAQKWGVQSLTRFPGQGQVASEGFKNNRFLDGQLVLMDHHPHHQHRHHHATTNGENEDCFSFVWVPTKHHVFFGRPSPEVVLHMLRDTLSKEDTLDNMRDHATHCWNVPFCSKARPPLDTRRTTRHNHNTNDNAGRRPTTTEPSFQRIKSTRDLQSMDITPPSSSKSSQETRFSFWQVKKWKSFIDKALSDDKKQK
eukprot:scaffold115417_cov33-Attheya_sp.AAC.1